MIVNLTKDAEIDDANRKAGESVDVMDEVGRQLIATGSAVLPSTIERVIEELEELPKREPIPAPKKARKHAS